MIAAVERPHPARVALDGVDGAGKTHLADELVGPLSRRAISTTPSTTGRCDRSCSIRSGPVARWSAAQRRSTIALTAQSRRRFSRRTPTRFCWGQQLYLDSCHPKASADVIFENSAFDAPRLTPHA
jgi:hypothetical protein